MDCKTLIILLTSVSVSQTMIPSLSYNGEQIYNHSYLDLNKLGDTTFIRCLSNRPTCCTSNNKAAIWVTPHGLTVQPNTENIDNLFVKYGDGYVDLGLNKSVGVIPTSGIYICDAQLAGDSTGRNNVYVGLYNDGGDVSVSPLIKYNNISDLSGESPQFNLTCISTGGPATTVTWTRDSMPVVGSQNTVLEDIVTTQYSHTLTVVGRFPGRYTCNISNEKPSSDSASYIVAVAWAPTVTRLCQKSAERIMVEWTVPQPIGFTTGYRIHYYTDINDPVSTTINVFGGVLTTSYILTKMAVELYYISVEGVSLHFPSGRDQAIVHSFEVRSEDEPYMCLNLTLHMKEECEMSTTEGNVTSEVDGDTGDGMDDSAVEEGDRVEDDGGDELEGEEKNGCVEEVEGSVEDLIEDGEIEKRQHSSNDIVLWTVISGLIGLIIGCIIGGFIAVVIAVLIKTKHRKHTSNLPSDSSSSVQRSEAVQTPNNSSPQYPFTDIDITDIDITRQNHEPNNIRLQINGAYDVSDLIVVQRAKD